MCTTLACVGYLWLEITLAQLRGIEPYEVLQALSGGQRYPVPGHSPGGCADLDDLGAYERWATSRGGPTEGA
jgi:hypothetical protein